MTEPEEDVPHTEAPLTASAWSVTTAVLLETYVTEPEEDVPHTEAHAQVAEVGAAAEPEEPELKLEEQGDGMD